METVLLLPDERAQIEARLKTLADLNTRYLKDRKEAADEGDLRENFAYEQANKNLQDVKREADKLQETLAKSKTLDMNQVDRTVVGVGVMVTFSVQSSGSRNLEGTVYKVLFVDENRGFIFLDGSQANRMSKASAIGKAIEGLKVGELATVKTTYGEDIVYRVDKLE